MKGGDFSHQLRIMISKSLRNEKAGNEGRMAGFFFLTFYLTSFWLHLPLDSYSWYSIKSDAKQKTLGCREVVISWEIGRLILYPKNKSGPLL